MRVFLHDLVWQQDQKGFAHRIDEFLKISAKHHIKPVFVLFDSCWDPAPRLGPQLPPRPGIHNSRWVQSPGAKALQDSNETIRSGVLQRIAADDVTLPDELFTAALAAPSTRVAAIGAVRSGHSAAIRQTFA